MRRRTFLQSSLASAALLAAGSGQEADAQGTRPERPNILWISAEDISPDLGCYGDTYATTPNIDAFAKRSVRYDRAYSHSGVCAPSRSGIITGMYPTSIGTHHMRCTGVPPAGVKCFTEYLRAAGYYCTNNKKTDYQFAPPPSAWDESSKRAHWRKRPEGAPFFSVINFTVCHESQVRSRDPQRLAEIDALGPDKHDPEKAPVPPYHADTPATRHDWAQYYDVITLMDKQVGETLKELEEDGLAEDTIVWFWGDHGRGLTRGKRWLYESGTRIPLLIHVPEKWRTWARPDAPESLAPGTRDDLVCFVDFAPTVLSLAGVTLPEHFQGQAFLGRADAEPRDHIYGARDRMDEAYDLIRTARDKRFRYFRNYMPYVTYAQDIDYMNEMPMAQDLRRLYKEGKLTADQAKWFAPTKPLEELYDVTVDPHELNNLAGNPKYQADLERLRKVHLDWMEKTGDLGLIPEPAFDAWRDRGGKMQVAAPRIQQAGGSITVASPTPGASIMWRWADASPDEWTFYRCPIPNREGVALHARANRIGFEDSDVSRSDSEGAAAEPVLHAHPMDSDDLLRPLLARLRALRALDDRADQSTALYLETLADPEPAMRYWAVVLLHRMVDPELRESTWVEALRPLLGDESGAVRIASAHGLCDWGEAEIALPVLEKALAGSGQSERLFAATALGQLGELARPALPALEMAAKDKSVNVAKVSSYAVARLKGEG